MMKRWTLFVVAATAVVLTALVGPARAAATAALPDASGRVVIPFSTVTATARYFEFSDGGTNIRFFAVMGADKRPRVAFDACDVCGGSLGYQQEGPDIVCGTCGRVFRIDGIGTKNTQYGCWPSYLPFSVTGSTLVIRDSDLKRGRPLFEAD